MIVVGAELPFDAKDSRRCQRGDFQQRKRKPKSLFTERAGGELIERYHAEDEHDEDALDCSRDEPSARSRADRWAEMAVFYRANAQSRAIEEQLSRTGVPYKVVGGTKFYDRREIKDLLVYMRAMLNPDDEMSLRRMIKSPSAVSVMQVSTKSKLWQGTRSEFRRSVASSSDAGVTGKALTGIGQFMTLMDDLWPNRQ